MALGGTDGVLGNLIRRILRQGPGVGDDVTVLAGPFAGHAGRVARRQPDGRFLVVIDECCQPLVAAADLRVMKSTGIGDQLESIHHEIELNPDAELMRGQASAAQQPHGPIIGPPAF
jgi:KOW motif-containing protein